MAPDKRSRKTVSFAPQVTFAPSPSCRRDSSDNSSSSSERPHEAEAELKSRSKRRRTMTEPRARAARHKGQLNFGPEMTSLLYAFGDSAEPLPETVRILDEIVTDFIIELCHSAARAAAVSRRQKIKVEDFKWAIRGDELMLGRVRELLGMDKKLKEARKQFNTDEGKVGLERGGRKRKFKEDDDGPAEGS